MAIDRTVPPIALVLHLKDNFSKASDVVSENTKKVIAADAHWFEEIYIPNDSIQATLGYTGEIEDFGLYQINIIVPLEEGRVATYQYVQELSLLFKHGTTIQYNGYDIFIEKSTPTQGFKQDNWYVVPFTITWSCYMSLI